MRKIKIAHDFDSFFENPEKLPSAEEKQKQLQQSSIREQKEKKIREWLTPLFLNITGYHPEEISGVSVNEMLEEIRDYIEK